MNGSPVAGQRTEAPLSRIVSSAMLIHAVSAMVELGVVERMSDGPRPVSELAREVGVPEERLLVVLRAVTAAELVVQTAPGVFALSPAGNHLRPDDPLGLRDLFRMCTYGDLFQAWTRLGRSVGTGRAAFEIHTGSALFDYLSENQDAAEVFNRAMNASTPAGTLLRAADLEDAGTVVDLGGGEGATLAAVLRARPGATGTLFDLPEVVAGAPALLRDAGVDDRCSVVGGSFFEGVPEGADVYVMARVMQNWSDRDAVRILANVRAAMSAGSRLLIVGHLPERDRPSAFVEAISLSMFVLYGAPLRSAEEYEELFAEVGLVLRSVHRVPDGESVMDVRPV
ncbi:methyltransferase [Nocardiopsis eucommiae]|uniref:Methyltransferase n=2 Tax=Nocardiopsidaceae TaxID=83676 RepID=A0A975LDT3_9ACTN|nr:methyltransferase [Nocardiopsis eucommiae]